jgi:nitrate/nitrite transporter NarK
MGVLGSIVRSAAMLVVIAAIMPRVLMIVAVVIAIVVTLVITRPCDHAGGRKADEAQQDSAPKNSLYICHVCSRLKVAAYPLLCGAAVGGFQPLL